MCVCVRLCVFVLLFDACLLLCMFVFVVLACVGFVLLFSDVVCLFVGLLDLLVFVLRVCVVCWIDVSCVLFCFGRFRVCSWFVCFALYVVAFV